MGNKDQVAIALYNIGNIYLDQGTYNNASISCHKSLNLSKEIGAINIQKYACECLYEAYKGLSNSNKALEYHEQLTALNDSIFNEAEYEKTNSVRDAV